MSRPRCFIVQEPMRKNAEGIMETMMDMRKVIDYGSPVVMLKSGRVGFTPGPTIDALRNELRDFTENDYLVPAGDPTAMCMAAMIASERTGGVVNVLKWDKIRKEYVSVKIDIFYNTRGAI